MKPGNLQRCKVPNPAVRRKMRLDFSFFARPGTGVRFSVSIAKRDFAIELLALIAHGLRGTPRLVGARDRFAHLWCFYRGKATVKSKLN